MSRNTQFITYALFPIAVSILGCGSNGSVGPKTCNDIPDTSRYIIQNAPPTSSDDCDRTLTATNSNDQIPIIEAIVSLSENGVLCLEPGNYDMADSVTVSGPTGLTIKGIGSSPDDVVLNYESRGAEGILVNDVDGVTVENLWIQNTIDNAVENTGSNSVFRKIRVSWDGEPRVENGAYGIYPIGCTNVVIEYCQVQGASDAGVYVGQCTDSIVRNNLAHQNVAGLEVENSTNIEAFDNELFDNTGGLLALQEPISEARPSNTEIRMFNNEVYCNNRENFSRPGSSVTSLPQGMGGLSFGGNNIEIFNNRFTDNRSIGFGIASNILNCQISDTDCPNPDTGEYPIPGYDPYSTDIYIYDNLFTNNGTAPTESLAPLFNMLGFATGDDTPPVPDVVWGGYQETPGNANNASICLGTDQTTAPTILVFGNACQSLDQTDAQLAACILENHSTDPTPYFCEPK